ncbi:hypothetical protein HHK36_022356 [Tetracentron sinense]|uniref:Uncharacterized protein n=1 Tax=Tetracentron sinense TaxID=13715 RepID=A0A834YUS2_TETSI|nr:hypothetical protein HHK36_022356 [Tetracentron sinense]
MNKRRAVDFYVLPEGIISLTSPRDACRSSLVSSIFKSAADLVAVWEKFLPSNYQDIISRSVSPSPVGFSSKKDLFLRLCNHPILIDEGYENLIRLRVSSDKNLDYLVSLDVLD